MERKNMLKREWEQNKNRYKEIFILTFLWGIISHGIMFFNKFSFFDELHYMFGVGHTYPLGRWALGVMEAISRFLFGSPLFSLPILNGGLSLVCMAASICVIVKVLEIQSKWSVMAICGILVAFPTITCMFGYMYTAPYYMIGFFLGVLGVGIVCSEEKKWYRLVAGSALFACAIGVYQAFIPFLLCLVLFYFMNRIWKEKIENWGGLLKEATYLGAFCGMALAIYYVVLKIFLKCLNLQMSGYKGANQEGLLLSNLEEYKWRIILAYQEFFQPSGEKEYKFWNVYPWNMEKIYYILLILIAIVSMIFLFRLGKRRWQNGLWFAFLLLLVPFATNFIFIMVDKWSVYALTNYGQAMVFVFFIWQMENIKLLKIEGKKWIYGAGIALMLFSGISYSRYANVCYLNAELMRNQMISYYSTLITRIQSMEGYTDELPVAFLNGGQKESLNWPQMEEFEEIAMECYRWDGTINDNSWVRFMEYYCGYAPKMIEDVTVYEENPKVKDMPSYPDDGGIQIIDGVIVVKFQ